MKTRFALAVLISLVATPALGEKRYSADRYDSHIDVLDGGALRVTETIVIRFESDTFTQFYRAIPVRLTDGVEVVSTSMDGETLTRGTGPGQAEISGSSTVRVTWHFDPRSNSAHTFQVMYLARGVVRQEQDADVFAWNILPTEHLYAIGSTTAEIILPAPPARTPSIESHRVAASSVDVDGGHIRITASSIRGNGWLQTTVQLPRGSVVTEPPGWQQQQVEISRLSRVWLLAAAIVIVLGLGVLFFIRQQYDSPARDFSTIQTWALPPDTLSPVVAGTLVANGSPRLEHAMSALFSLADRGELRIDEQSRLLGQRQFAITRIARKRPLEPYEERLLEIIFGTDGQNSTVSLWKARSRLQRQIRRFKAVLEPALVTAGLLDPDRRHVRRQFMVVAISCLLAAALTCWVFAFLVERFGPWPMLMPLALGIVGVAALISGAAHTPLSNDGVRRAREWRGFRQHLRDLARDRQPSPGESVLGQLLPFAVALGLAHSWSSYLKRHRSAAPEWFRAMSAADNNSAAAFSAFVASGGGTSHGAGAHAGAAGAAAGGGASGAS